MVKINKEKEEVSKDCGELDQVIESVSAQLKKYQGMQNSVKRVEEFNALEDLMSRRELVIQLLNMAKRLMRR